MPIIELSDGTRHSVPEGTDPQEFLKQHIDARLKMRADLQKRYEKENAQYNPFEEMDPLTAMAAGFHRGVRKQVRGIGNALGLVSDETANREAELEKYMDSASWGENPLGKLGNFAGSTAIPAAVGAYTGGLGIMNPFGTVTKNAALQGGVMSGLTGAVEARPGERLGNAAAGAAIGAITGGLTAKALEKFAKGPVETSDAYKNLKSSLNPDFAEQLPVYAKVDNSTAGGRLTEAAYRDILPWVPGGGSIHTQGEQAVKKYADQTVGKLMEPVANVVGTPSVAFEQDPHLYMKELQDGINRVYDAVRAMPFDMSGNNGTHFMNNVMPALRRVRNLSRGGNETVYNSIQNVIADINKAHNGEGVVSGDAIVQLLHDLGTLRTQYGGSQSYNGKLVQQIYDSVLQMGRDRTSFSPKLSAAWNAFEALKTGGGELRFAAVKEAMKKPLYGQATPSGIRDALLGKSSSTTVATGQVPHQNLMDTVADVTRRAAEKRTGAFQAGISTGGLGTNLLTGGLGFAAGGGLLGTAGAAVAPSVLAYGLTRQPVQRALVGELATQKALADVLQQHPYLASYIGQMMANRATAPLRSDDATN